jgi:hypothetical protein
MPSAEITPLQADFSLEANLSGVIITNNGPQSHVCSDDVAMSRDTTVRFVIDYDKALLPAGASIGDGRARSIALCHAS